MESANTPGPTSVAPLLTVNELASLLRVSETSIYRWVETRKMPFYRVEGCLRFGPDEVTRFLASRRVAPINEYERP